MVDNSKSPWPTTYVEVFGAGDIKRSLARIGYEIVEAAKGHDDFVLLGIHNRGVPLAKRIASAIIAANNTSRTLSELTGSLDITLFRDDLAKNPLRTPQATKLPDQGIDGKSVILVDDVLFSGRSVRAGLDALNSLGRAKEVKLAVLVDRGHRQLPIRADFVGKNLPTALTERVQVNLQETDGFDSVILHKEIG